MNISDLPYIMLKCLVFTIIIELIIALILGVRYKKDIINIILVNIVTNPVVVSLPVFMLVRYGYDMQIKTLYILEVITILVEGFIYKKVLNYKKINPFILSLILNLGSYLIGKML